MTAIDSHFAVVPEGVQLRLTDIEVTFLTDLPRLLAGLGTAESDPAAARLAPPVYLGDPEADAEWRRLAGTELEASRRADRSAFESVLEAVSDSLPESAASDREESVGSAVISRAEADAVLRVVNEARLVLGRGGESRRPATTTICAPRPRRSSRSWDGWCRTWPRCWRRVWAVESRPAMRRGRVTGPRRLRCCPPGWPGLVRARRSSGRPGPCQRHPRTSGMRRAAWFRW